MQPGSNLQFHDYQEFPNAACLVIDLWLLLVQTKTRWIFTEDLGNKRGACSERKNTIVRIVSKMQHASL